MVKQILHIFRNTPFGREMLLQSIYFSKKINASLKVYIPKHLQFLMYFENDVVTVDLNKSFLRSPETAREHASAVISEAGLKPSFIKPKGFTASTLPEIPVNFDYMCCPRSIADLSTKIGLGYIGPKVRNIIKNASFPVIIPTPVYKEWKNITIFFGGSANAGKALQLAISISKASGFPLQLFTQAKRHSRHYYQEKLKGFPLYEDVASGKINWLFFERGRLRDNLYAVPHDSLVVVGAYGHGLVKEVLFGSMMEQIQTVLPNNMLIVGPHYISS